MPGQFIPGADSHSRAYGAYGARRDGRRIDDARFRLVDRLHLLHRLPSARRVVFSGQPAAVGERQGHRPRAAARAGVRSSRRACRWSSSTRTRQLPIAYRNTIANMMAEAEALNGIFAAGRR